MSTQKGSTKFDRGRQVPGGKSAPPRSRPRTWSRPAMAEFRGSSATNPWVLGERGNLVLSFACEGNVGNAAPAAEVTKNAAGTVAPFRRPYPGIMGGLPSSIRQSSLRVRPSAETSRALVALGELDAGLAAGCINTSTHVRGARETSNASPRNRPRSRVNNENSRVISWFRSPSTSAGATRLVHRTPAEKARQMGSWEF
ncbi:hypothetical protein C8R45DRAFT_927405 [Mycena sanguinolenta]|nr:hypothetical protein C8R45DRAFT_927405 [Mycena sanguinolenta]